jgi:hypothetical protein
MRIRPERLAVERPRGALSVRPERLGWMSPGLVESACTAGSVGRCPEISGILRPGRGLGIAEELTLHTKCSFCRRFVDVDAKFGALISARVLSF